MRHKKKEVKEKERDDEMVGFHKKKKELLDAEGRQGRETSLLHRSRSHPYSSSSSSTTLCSGAPCTYRYGLLRP